MTDAALAIDADDLLAVEVEQFSGPMDLLLHLIREQDIDIFDIPIARITRQFLVILEKSRLSLSLERAGEFLEMAATLVRIKAQMLLPRRATDDGAVEDPRAELVRRLIEYEHFRDVAQILSASEALRLRRFRKGFVPPRPRIVKIVDEPFEFAWADVVEAVRLLDERAAQRITEHRYTARAVKVEDKIDLIMGLLSRVARVEFHDLVQPWGTRVHAIASLLALLELTRRRNIALRQNVPFERLWIYRRRPVGLTAIEPDVAPQEEADASVPDR